MKLCFNLTGGHARAYLIIMILDKETFIPPRQNI